MSRIFNELKDNFSQIPNELINNHKLSKEARFLFILLGCQSKDFDLKQKWILKMMGWKDRNTLAKYWSEIENAGWGYRERRRLEGGRLGVYDYYIFAKPDTEKVTKFLATSVGSTHSGNDPQWVQPIVDQTHTLNNTNSLNNTKKENKTKGSFVAPTVREIAQFMFDYMKKREAFKTFQHPNYWAKYMAEEYLEHFEGTGWKSGSKKLESIDRTAQRWVRTEEKKGTLKRCPPNHPEFGVKPWEKAAEAGVPSDYVSPLHRR